jgi:hypothetical protein
MRRANRCLGKENQYDERSNEHKRVNEQPNCAEAVLQLSPLDVSPR